MTKEYDKARADYVTATELDPKCAAAWRALGVHDLSIANAPARAVDALDKAVALEPADASSYVLRAKAKVATGDESLVASALEDLGQAIQLDPNCAEAHFARASVEREREQYGAALADLRMALALEPDNATYRQLWNAIHKADSERLVSEAETLLNEGRYDEAAARVRKALEIDPTSEAFHEALHIIDVQRKGK
jgi:tetratricopeptide (TPR) repeat protein